MKTEMKDVSEGICQPRQSYYLSLCLVRSSDYDLGRVVLIILYVISIIWDSFDLLLTWRKLCPNFLQLHCEGPLTDVGHFNLVLMCKIFIMQLYRASRTYCRFHSLVLVESCTVLWISKWCWGKIKFVSLNLSTLWGLRASSWILLLWGLFIIIFAYN